MAKGDDRLAQQQAADEERRAQWAASNKPQLFLKDNEAAIVRFLEQGPDKHNFGVHEYVIPNPQNPGKPNRRTFTCLNDNDDGTPCPGCQASMKRKLKGVYNVIQRNRPVLRKGQDGKAIKFNGEYIVDGYQDEVVIFTGPSTTANMIRQKDVDYNGLMMRDMKLAKNGTQFSPFTLEPADIDSGPQPMSQADIALMQQKYDLNEFMQPPTFQQAAELVAKYGGQAQQGQAPPPSGQAQPAPGNPYLGGSGQPQPQAQPPAPPVPPPPPTPPVPPTPPQQPQAQPVPPPTPPAPPTAAPAQAPPAVPPAPPVPPVPPVPAQ